MFGKVTAAAFAAALLCTGANAASVSWSSYSSANLAQAKTDRAALDVDFQVAFEDFESFSPVLGNTGTGSFTPLNTAVGVFTTTPGATCGGSCNQPNDQSLVRNASSFGRYNTTDSGAQWLDSNDNAAINLAGSAGSNFDSISFFLTDIDDVGLVTFNIDVDGQNFDIAADIFNGLKQQNGDLFLVRIELGGPVASSALSLNIDTGDGFGLDDVRLGSGTAPGPSPVPVPASLPLLLGGLGAIAWAKRRRKAA